MRLLDEAAIAISAAGVAVAVVAAARCGRLRAGFPLMLDLWAAAALLRLAGEPQWTVVATAAALIVTRHVVGAALTAHRA